MKLRLFVVLVMLSLGCRERLMMTPPPMPELKCGDAIITPDLGEECEGSDVGEHTCQSKGFDTGQVTCTAECKISTALCVKKCGNGVIDPGEACDGTLGVPVCADFGYVACSDTCQVDRSHCITTPFNPPVGLQLSYGGVAAVGDLNPKGLGDLVMVVPARMRVETFPWTVERGFDGTTGRKLDFGFVPKAAMPADLDGDGTQDIGVINVDGTIDRYRAAGTSFSPERYPDGGAAVSWLGKATSDAGTVLVANGTDELLVLATSGLSAPQRLSTPGRTAAAIASVGGTIAFSTAAPDLKLLVPPAFAGDGTTYVLPVAPQQLAVGDLDGDGDLDAAAFDGTSVKVLENTGVAFADKLTLPAAGASSLTIADLDLDGRLDLVWESSGRAQVRRNMGAFVFAPFDGALGAGTPLGLSVGDVDGDGDLDLAATESTGGETVVTYVLVNRVR